MDPARPWAEAIAVRGGRVIAVGSSAEVRAVVDASAEVVDAKGGTVLPGFQDAHCHPTTAGRERLHIDLSGIAEVADYLDRVRAYAESHREEDWLFGGGWSMASFPGGVASAAELDSIVPDRPVFIMNRDGHGAWVNTVALERAGITRDTRDPWDGRVERDASGNPVGTLHEGAAYRVRDEFLPDADVKEWERAFLESQRYLHSLGITGLQDAWVTPETLNVYRDLAERGLLTMHVATAQWWQRDEDNEQIERFLAGRRLGNLGPLSSRTVKIMIDGVAENYTAAMVRPYFDGHGHETDNTGKLFVGQDELATAVTELDRIGFQVHMHAIGDLAVRSALDAVTAARKANGASGHRHHIAHVQVIDPVDVPRFSALGVTANCQPYWACASPQVQELTVPFLGEERAAWQYPFMDLVRSGAKLAFGSDWSVSTPNPLLEMEVAVTRVHPASRGDEPFLPEQRVDLATALRAFTEGSSWVSFDDEAGVLAPGRRADLAVLDRDLFDPGSGPIGDTTVVLTVAAGRVVYERP
jgi:predicted amidohydrolase YtcJ